MIIPIKCFTCGEVLADKYRYYLEQVRKMKVQKGIKVDKVLYLTEDFAEKTPEGEVMDQLQKAGVPAGVVQNPADILRDPQLKHRRHFWKMNHPELGLFPHLGQSYQLSSTPAQPRMPAPCLGEHTEYVCKTFLGISDQEFEELVKEGVL